MLTAVAAGQLGLFTRAQAREAGFSVKEIRHRLRDRRWCTITSGVLCDTQVPVSAAIVDRASQLAVPGSVLAGMSAARVWGIDVPDPRPCLLVARTAYPPLRGVKFLRSQVAARDIGQSADVAVTSRPRAIFDCLYLLPLAPAIELLDRAMQRRWLTLPELIERVQLHAGQIGAPRLVELVRLAASGARSEAERQTAELLHAAAITGWQANVAIRDKDGVIGLGDFVFSAERLVVEIDGIAYHSSVEQFQRDRHRQNRLVTAGWTVLRFTWRDVTQRPAYVIDSIRAILRRTNPTFRQ